MTDPAPGMLFELGDSAPNDSEPGPVETGTRTQIEALTRLGYISDANAGQVALALATAKQIDALRGKGAASGQANLSRALKEIFETLPSPDAATSDVLGDALKVIMAPANAEAR